MEIKSSENIQFELEAKNWRDWLLPLGYKEVYQNHPLDKEREIHFQKGGVIVACIYGKFGHEPHCQLIYTIWRPIIYEVRTMRYSIRTPALDSIHEDIKKSFGRFNKQESFLFKLIKKIIK